jgi:hypothetical protein
MLPLRGFALRRRWFYKEVAPTVLPKSELRRHEKDELKKPCLSGCLPNGLILCSIWSSAPRQIHLHGEFLSTNRIGTEKT